MTTTRFVNLLVSLKCVTFVQKDLFKEFRRYRCNLDGTEMSYRSLILHMRWRHREEYNFVKKIMDERIAVKKDMVLCLCGGHYKPEGKKQHELTGIHRKWELTHNRYPILQVPEQTISTLT